MILLKNKTALASMVIPALMVASISARETLTSTRDIDVQQFSITEEQENKALEDLHTSLCRLFKKASKIALPLIVKAIKSPSSPVKEKVIEIIKERQASVASGKEKNKEDTFSWSVVFTDVVNGFFPGSKISDLQKEDSPLGKIIDGSSTICMALDGTESIEAIKDVERAEEENIQNSEGDLQGTDPIVAAVDKVLEGITDLNSGGRTRCYLRGTSPKISTPKQLELSRKTYENSPYEALLGGAKKVFIAGKLFKSSFNKGIDMIIEAILRLNFQYLHEGEETKQAQK